MKRTRLDFLAPARGSARTGIALFVIGALLAGGAVLDDADRSDELAQLQARLKKARTDYRHFELARTPGDGAGLAELKQSGDIARRLTSPWGDLLDALEHAQTDTIALLAIEPSADQGKLRLNGEAKNMDAVVDYIKSLDGKAGLSGLRLLTQQIKQGDPQHPVEFVIEAHWVESAVRRTAAVEANS